MSIRQFRNLIKETAEYVLDNIDNSYILIGENIAGKSELLLFLMGKCFSMNLKFYFIDSVNRTFQLTDTKVSNEITDYNYKKVCEKRLEKQNFNRYDTFASGRIEALYWNYEQQLKNMIWEFWGINIDIKKCENGPVAMEPRFDIIKDGVAYSEKNEELKIPNGMQAVLRLFIEILYFEESIKNDLASMSKPIVIIEELDLYLSENYSSQILNFLIKSFPQFVFVVTTHSRELTLETENVTVIALKEGERRIVYSGENYQLDIEELFADVFHTDEMNMYTNDDELDRKLRVLLNRKIENCWNEHDQKEMDKLAGKHLLPHQKFLVDKIREWKYE